MPHGTPDWGAKAPKSTVYGGIDLAEHAARLGSPVTFDRRGDVIWFDDFESGVNKWLFAGTGLGNTQSWSAEAAKIGGFSCKLVCGTGLGITSEASRYTPYSVLSTLGLEAAINIDDAVSQFIISFFVYSSDTLYDYRIKYLSATHKLQVRDSAGVYQDLSPAMYLYDRSCLFHVIKLVINAKSGCYTRLIVDDTTFDLSSYSAETSPGGLDPTLLIDFLFLGKVAQNATSYIDDVILTQNEP